MDQVIQQLQFISDIYSSLDETSQQEFGDVLNTNMVTINNAINNMYTHLSKYSLSPLSQPKMNQLLAEYQKDRVIANVLFPYYWLLKESLNSRINQTNKVDSKCVDIHN